MHIPLKFSTFGKSKAMYKMDNRLMKKNIFDKCVEIQLEKISHLESAMEDAQKSANDYGQQSDVFDSHKMQLIGKRDMYATQLKIEMAHLETLHKIDLTINHKAVEFGSVVITDMQRVYISVGLGKLTVDNETYYAISLKVPFFLAMKGLKKGDAFEFRGSNIKILDIF